MLIQEGRDRASLLQVNNIWEILGDLEIKQIYLLKDITKP